MTVFSLINRSSGFVLIAGVFLVSLSCGPEAAHAETAKVGAPSSKKATTKEGKAAPSQANRFNRLFKGAAGFNLPPTEDGIHDPDSVGTQALQPPKQAFEDLPKGKAGNRVDWVQALDIGVIQPRTDKAGTGKAMTVLDLNIVREVKGSMPDVVYPHKPHTKWLQCSNCHPKIFIPKKGANKISMAAILAGQYCGVCHGKVAFPISECRLCHSKNKTKEQIAAQSTKHVSARTQAARTEAKGTTAPAAAAKPDSVLDDMSVTNLMKLGQTIYTDICSGCHGDKGQGVPGTFPALKGSKIASGDPAKHIDVVVNGRPETAMQPWKEDLNAQEIAAVITFERASWGNAGGPVQPRQVHAAISGGKAAEPPAPKSAPVKAVEKEASAKAKTATLSKEQLMSQGAAVYAENCSACHGEKGEGVPDVAPPLKGSKIVSGPIDKHIEIVLNGRPETAMQAWNEILSPEATAAVITFERNSWGNAAGDTVQPSEIAKGR
ncbi:MAG: hypothetical protein COW30_08475 [Rhodospirillales bacterium CG15_BIG_FIL_POST_REV_8_21_14_020_66_15]|nr:MAG: hypothetical protein COW30_08475 [Rhodospirillales bacterium CG15_BIG_FIL_POST_REV_8_21_14_020_66_15]